MLEDLSVERLMAEEGKNHAIVSETLSRLTSITSTLATLKTLSEG